MSIKMIALRRFYYPSGPSGQQYEVGDEVEILSERDAKALTLVKSVKLASDAKDEAPTPTSANVTRNNEGGGGFQFTPPPPPPEPEPAPVEAEPEQHFKRSRKRDGD